MSKRIEKFMILACVLHVFGLFSFIVANMVTNWMLRHEIGSSSMVPLVTMLSSFVMLLPLRFVCGFWLKGEARQVGGNPWVWFFVGFIFDLIGIIAFYAYMIFRKGYLAQSPAGDSAQEH